MPIFVIYLICVVLTWCVGVGIKATELYELYMAPDDEKAEADDEFFHILGWIFWSGILCLLAVPIAAGYVIGLRVRNQRAQAALEAKRRQEELDAIKRGEGWLT